MALLWASAICWMAVEYVGVAPEPGSDTSSTSDDTGAAMSREQVRQVEEALKNL